METRGRQLVSDWVEGAGKGPTAEPWRTETLGRQWASFRPPFLLAGPGFPCCAKRPTRWWDAEMHFLSVY